jgi:transcription termination/antitermination protein NusA
MVNNQMSNNKKIIKDASALGQFGSAIAQICEEKGIDKDRVVETIEAALAAAYKKDYGKKGQIIIAKMAEKTGEVDFKQLKEVVDETTRTIEEDAFEKKEMELPEKAKKSEEEVERPKMEIIDPETQESVLPRFNPERDILLEDAKKIDKTLVVGDFLEIPLETKDQYGRVASQTAKQVIIQRIREAERDAMYDEYKSKEGEVINGVVQRVEGRTVYIDLGKSVGALFPSEQISGENYRIGQRLKVYLDKVESDPKGPGITLSRSHPGLLKKLFELEVPEIFTGTVEIKSIAREAGSRSKIAVASNEEGIDPIGSCVGQKGTRVQAVIDEIGGEKIDIIEWNDDVAKLIASSLSPAKVIKVEIKEDHREAKVFVPGDQLSLAIGKRGQNVRLAVKLTGWKIDVESIGDEEEKAEEKPEDEVKAVESEQEAVVEEDKVDKNDGNEKLKEEAKDKAEGQEEEKKE